MSEKIEKEGLKHLKTIEKALGELKERTPHRLGSLINGIWYGAGWVVGSVLALTFLGWALSIFGLVPGFDTLAHYFQDAAAQLNRHY